MLKAPIAPLAILMAFLTPLSAQDQLCRAIGDARFCFPMRDQVGVAILRLSDAIEVYGANAHVGDGDVRAWRDIEEKKRVLFRAIEKQKAETR